jgi:hypothetical protein
MGVGLNPEALLRRSSHRFVTVLPPASPQIRTNKGYPPIELRVSADPLLRGILIHSSVGRMLCANEGPYASCVS